MARAQAAPRGLGLAGVKVLRGEAKAEKSAQDATMCLPCPPLP